ncbi:MAG TPA: histidine phosphatase family protein [Sphingomicrobium sp.]
MRSIFLSFVAIAVTIMAAMPVLAGGPVYVIRHLERAPGDADPSLSERGAARAEQLAALLANAKIKAVFATATKRAQETGAPLAKAAGLQVTTYDPRDVDALAAAVEAAGGPVLVVGHSNTVASLVAKFGGAKPAELTEQDYGTLFVVHEGTAQVNRIDLN